MRPSLIFQIFEESQIGEVRRAGVALAEILGLNEVRCGEVALVLTEAGTNLVKHGGGGEVVLQLVRRSHGKCLEVLVFDRGPGIRDIETCKVDGYSTTGTLGTGMGAMARLANAFDIFSDRGFGTIISAQFWKADFASTPNELAIGSLQLAYPNEEVSGDKWVTHHEGARTIVAVVDGLGHGPEASLAAETALDFLSGAFRLSPSEILRGMHAEIKKTRGAAAAVAAIDSDEMMVTYCGVGNVVGIIADDVRSQSLISHDGTVGYIAPSFHEYKYAWTDHSSLIMHSDGLSSRFRPQGLSNAIAHDPGIIAALFLRDCKRARDDITVVVAKRLGQ